MSRSRPRCLAIAAAALAAMLAAPALAQTPIRGEDGDRFGSSMAAGDFDGDRLVDLAVGIPGKQGGSGLVVTFRGTVRGLQPWQVIEQAALGASAPGDRFGLALIAGDFDGDGRDDLAVGAPGAVPGATPRMDAVPPPRSTPPEPPPPPPPPPPAPMRREPPLSRGDRARVAADGLVVQAAGDAPRAGVVFIYGGTPGGLIPQQTLDQSLLKTGVNQAGDDFGGALAAGDFDGDRIADLAVGAPGDAPVPGGPRSGFVFVFRGTRSNGLVPARGLEAELAGLAVNGERDDFGSALAAGDFDGDRIADLAIGAPGKAAPGGQRSGIVLVFRGKRVDGLQASTALDEQLDGLGTSEEGDEFGRALAAGDFDRDGIDDLVVGAPGETPGTDPRAGFAFLFRGTRSGFRAAQGLEQELASARGDALDTNARGDEFGSALAAGDFDGDGNLDLAVGVPGKSGSGTAGTGTGSVLLFRGRGASLLQLDSRIQAGEVEGAARGPDDRLGAALAAGDFDRDGRAELAVGAPGAAPPNGARAGCVFEFAGTPAGLRADQRLDQSGGAQHRD